MITYLKKLKIKLYNIYNLNMIIYNFGKYKKFSCFKFSLNKLFYLFNTYLYYLI